jgi:hypothetical protein
MDEKQIGSVHEFDGIVEMDMSKDIGKLAGSLAKAQGKIRNAKKDSTNPFFKSDYADLSSVWNACRAELSSNDIAVIQTLDSDPDGRVYVITTIAHSSGQWMRGRIGAKPTKNDPQGIGSTLTYLRRYSLAAMVGVAPAGEDDDGQAGSTKGDTKPATTSKKKPQAKPEPEPEPEPENENALTVAQVKGLMAKAKANGFTEKEFDDMILRMGFEKRKDLTMDVYDVLVDEINEGPQTGL